MSSNGGRQELQKSLNMKDVLALAFGTMIGWGWIMLAGSWVGNGGTLGAIIAFLLGGVMAIFVGLTYAELTPALPLAGGELVFSYRAMGYNASWFTGWMITLAYLGVAAWEGPALSNALGFLFGNAGFRSYRNVSAYRCCRSCCNDSSQSGRCEIISYFPDNCNYRNGYRRYRILRMWHSYR